MISEYPNPKIYTDTVTAVTAVFKRMSLPALSQQESVRVCVIFHSTDRQRQWVTVIDSVQTSMWLNVTASTESSAEVPGSMWQFSFYRRWTGISRLCSNFNVTECHCQHWVISRSPWQHVAVFILPSLNRHQQTQTVTVLCRYSVEHASQHTHVLTPVRVRL